MLLYSDIDYAALTQEQVDKSLGEICGDMESLGFSIHTTNNDPLILGVFACTRLSKYSKVRLSTVQYIADHQDAIWIKLRLFIQVARDVLKGELTALPSMTFPRCSHYHP